MKSRILAACATAALAGLSVWGAWKLWPRAAEPDFGSTDGPAAAAPSYLVTLTLEKAAAAGLERERCGLRSLQPTRTVSGRLEYDDTRHIELQAATAGVLTAVHVRPGVRVTKGQTLATLSSPEIGQARADLLRRTSERELARQQQQWSQATCEGLERLVAAVEAGGDVATVLTRLAGTTLGSYREQVLTAWLRHRLANTQANALAAVSDTGAIAGRVLQERQNERDIASAGLKAITEQSLFEARQGCATAKLSAADAERRFRISQQHLSTLLGYEEAAFDPESERSLSTFDVKAPFDGTIEDRHFSVNERVRQGDTLFTLADTAHLWAAADVRETAWEALRLAPGDAVSVAVAARPEHWLAAQVYYVGREVSPESHAVPLVARLENPDGSLRPGQFIRVRLPLGAPREALSVPEAAIVEHDGQAFVFVPEGERAFRRVDVQQGLSSDGYTEIVSGGLAAGMEVVSAGAFLLKSELLLAGEEE